ERAHRGAAHARPGRRCHRVPPQPARRGARRRARDTARLARARRDPVALRPDPRHVRRADRWRVRPGCRSGNARDRHDRRRHGGGGRGVSESGAGGLGPVQPGQGEPEGYVPSAAERFSVFQRAGGLVVPILTTILAFFIGGLVVLITTGHNPLSTYWAIFNGTGLTWFFHPGNYSIHVPFTDSHVWFPWNTNGLESPQTPSSRAAYALQQTLLLPPTL